jgi:hypothetical protein
MVSQTQSNSLSFNRFGAKKKVIHLSLVSGYVDTGSFFSPSFPFATSSPPQRRAPIRATEQPHRCLAQS